MQVKLCTSKRTSHGSRLGPACLWRAFFRLWHPWHARHPRYLWHLGSAQTKATRSGASWSFRWTNFRFSRAAGTSLHIQGSCWVGTCQACSDWKCSQQLLAYWAAENHAKAVLYSAVMCIETPEKCANQIYRNLSSNIFPRLRTNSIFFSRMWWCDVWIRRAGLDTVTPLRGPVENVPPLSTSIHRACD